MSTRSGTRGLIAAAILALAAASAFLALPAAAHGFSTVVYVDASAESEAVRTELALEYDLLVVSVADFANVLSVTLDDDEASSSLTMGFGGVVGTVTWWSSVVTVGLSRSSR